ncbi:MAG TPA: chemotaxis protein CheB, partial [Kofleriaceae bacterium]|nr:chemotaxis protein CheB [Kofleriaceae bacterium]
MTRVPTRVVGIGASAGGLLATKQVLAATPTDTGMAFVVMQHQARSRKSLLADALASSTPMPVLEVATGVTLAPDHVYVVPPGMLAVLRRGAILLRRPRNGARPHLPIDRFFQSLAETLGERAVGVVLSGTANDGTAGLGAIHAARGTTFAQEPSTAGFEDMPRNAIAAGAAATVLPAGEIGSALGALREGTPPKPPVVEGLDQVLSILRDVAGVDFTHYKRATIERRIARRLHAHQLTSVRAYADYLAEHPAEGVVLYEDLLIHVTEFFRDGPVLDGLVTTAFPQILRHLPASAAVRVWIAGCSTGQEAYSIAILLLELLASTNDRREVQIFGTDLSERAIEFARAGEYPEGSVGNVSPERLERYFTRTPKGWRIRKEVRERCVFVRHDLTADPPFSRVDVVSCRNVLIYLDPVLQQRSMATFHYALNPPGYLLLGRVESIRPFDELFVAVDGHAMLYTRKPSTHAPLLRPLTRHVRIDASHGERLRAPDVRSDVDQLLLARYAPACVVIDALGEIIQFRGRTGKY